jgi:hypothetical protein
MREIARYLLLLLLLLVLLQCWSLGRAASEPVSTVTVRVRLADGSTRRLALPTESITLPALAQRLNAVLNEVHEPDERDWKDWVIRFPTSARRWSLRSLLSSSSSSSSPTPSLPLSENGNEQEREIGEDEMPSAVFFSPGDWIHIEQPRSSSPAAAAANDQRHHQLQQQKLKGKQQKLQRKVVSVGDLIRKREMLMKLRRQPSATPHGLHVRLASSTERVLQRLYRHGGTALLFSSAHEPRRSPLLPKKQLPPPPPPTKSSNREEPLVVSAAFEWPSSWRTTSSTGIDSNTSTATGTGTSHMHGSGSGSGSGDGNSVCSCDNIDSRLEALRRIQLWTRRCGLRIVGIAVAPIPSQHKIPQASPSTATTATRLPTETVGWNREAMLACLELQARLSPTTNSDMIVLW